MNKTANIDKIWEYSRFYGQLFYDCDTLAEEGYGHASLLTFFNVTELVIKSVLEDDESSLYKLFKKLHEQELITEDEYNFLSEDKDSIRKIRNKFAHSSFYDYTFEDNDGVQYYLHEKETAIKLYKHFVNRTLQILVKLIGHKNK